MVKGLKKFLHNSKEIKTVNYVLFPLLNDKLFELYASEIPSVKSYISRYYNVDVDCVYIINDISCQYVPEGQTIVEHHMDSKSNMQIIETEDGKKVALIYMMVCVEEL